ncbi:FAD-dependent oxidoreductase [Nocardiopsis composta]|uniref:FAD-dependent urate hydroxylase n=1 Tax=Nocardiopsis composta TaxID=157465 RepID=A0A7W8QHI3_9ACTN|nr:FAD-dependent monooxygenase [Nocardiopsis composta]MBB5430567.1 FAD-dependent urate hydroxylase [Nocardiopsis composta]
MKVIVIGAGVGGLCAARGLLARGHEVEVYEKGEALRTGGAALGIYANGVAALDALGIRIDDLGRRLDSLEMADSDGRPRFTVDVASIDRRLGRQTRGVPRRDLLLRLAEGLPEQVLRFGARAESVRSAGRGAEVAFADGSTVRGDAVIGADGIHSPLRRALPGLPPAKATGWATWQALTPVRHDFTESHRSRCVQGPEGMCGNMPAGGGLLQWWFDVPWTPDSPAPASPAAMLRDRFARWTDPLVVELLDRAKDEDLGLYPHFLHEVPKVWGEGAATLLGDAAHAFPPAMAQGANQTIEDALALTRALGDAGEEVDVPEALRRYERTRRKGAALASSISSREMVTRNLPPAAVSRAVPDALWTWQFRATLSSISTVLRDGAPAPA